MPSHLADHGGSIRCDRAPAPLSAALVEASTRSEDAGRNRVGTPDGAGVGPAASATPVRDDAREAVP